MGRPAIAALLLMLAGCRFAIVGLDGSFEEAAGDGGATVDQRAASDGAGSLPDLRGNPISGDGSAPGVDAALVCTAPQADCNGNPNDGCEVNTDGDPQHCGSCGNACAPANATPGCSGGKCTVASCSAGFADCDGNAADGCEVQLASDAANCGGCGRACPAGGSGAACANGVCSTLPPMDAALVGYWNLDDAGPAIKDASPNRNDGLAVLATRTTGKVGAAAYHFNGLACIGIPDSSSLEMNGIAAMTMMAWARYSGGCANATHGIVVNHEQGYEMGPACVMNPTFQAAIQPMNVGWAWFGSQNETLNQWQHVAVTYDGANQRVYVDGVLTDTNALAGPMQNRLSGLGIGCRGVGADGDLLGASGFFIGDLDEVSIYSRALGTAEIQAYYNATK